MSVQTVHYPSRIELTFPDDSFPGLMFVGRYHQARALPGLDRHRHPRAIEICYLAAGMQVYEVAGQRYLMTGNDIYLTFPDEEHSTGEFPQEKGTLYWLQVRMPEEDEPFLMLAPECARPLTQELLTLPRRYFRGDWSLPRYFEEIIAAAQHPGPLQAVTIAAQVVQLLLNVIACAHAPTETSGHPDDIAGCLAYIERCLEQPVALEELAEETGLSLSRFKAKFKQVVGIPPAEYLLRRKISRAKELLRDGCSVTDVAHTLGFSSSQYFATVFKRFTGTSPGAIRRV